MENININNNKTNQDIETYEDIIERKYQQSLAEYYRHAIRESDKQKLKNIIKIPDNWNNFIPDNNINIDNYEKKRLSDIKNKTSIHLKYESLNILNIINVETTLLDTIRFRNITIDQVTEAIDSAKSLVSQNSENYTNFKHLLLSLAKRAVSDLYYLIYSYQKYFYKEQLNFENDFPKICFNFVNIFTKYKSIIESIPDFLNSKDRIDTFFPTNSNLGGYKVDEFALKKFFEFNNYELDCTIDNYKKILISILCYNETLERNYSFLRYYYNEIDGKLFRYNFITNSFSQKLKNKLISEKQYKLFSKIRGNFISITDYFEKNGLYRFGPQKFKYIDAVDLAYKICKIIEFCYLRKSQYEQLNEFRDDFSNKIKKDYDNFHNELLKV